jgi:hypothetical protein
MAAFTILRVESFAASFDFIAAVMSLVIRSFKLIVVQPFACLRREIITNRPRAEKLCRAPPELD